MTFLKQQEWYRGINDIGTTTGVIGSFDGGRGKRRTWKTYLPFFSQM